MQVSNSSTARRGLPWRQRCAVAASVAALAACGGGGGGDTATAGTGAVVAGAVESGSMPEAAAAAAARPVPLVTNLAAPKAAATIAKPTVAIAAQPAPMSARDAFRLADQASFGATEALVADIRAKGAASWITSQMAAPSSRYTLGKGDAIHKGVSTTGFCDVPPNKGPTCWRDWYSTQPLLWDFYRNATRQPDQLRQRVAFALQQIVVINSIEIDGTYGFRNYYNTLLDNAFGNYRQVLKKVALSPLMGDFLNSVNNDKRAPNENLGRELLQLFAIGTCALNDDGSLSGGSCAPNYDNAMVRNYAYALTGWTYPAGGSASWGCWPAGANCRYYGGDMLPFPALHDPQPRELLSGVRVPAGGSPAQALDAVLESLMQHPSMAPFVGRQLISHLVTNNPSPAYLRRVATAFKSGRYTLATVSFGSGQRGDLAATVAAVLLDSEARGEPTSRSAGRLREPVQLFTGVLRALNGKTDGDPLGYWWGDALRQQVFRPESVFSFYPSAYPVAGTSLDGPVFAIHNANAALGRLNYLTYLLYWNALPIDASIPGATVTAIDTTVFESSAGNAGALADRLSALAVGGPLPAAARSRIVRAIDSVPSSSNPGWRSERVRQAAFLVFGSPNYQLQR